MALRYTLTFFNLEKNQDDNAIIDDFDNSIDGGYFTTYTINDFAPFPIAKTTSIKVQLADTSAFNNKQLVYNYLRVKAVDNSGKYYFWVKRNIRLANNVVAFELEMDTLNAFRSDIITACGDSRNFVMREHIDRFRKENNNIIPIIDDIPEGFTLTQYKTEDRKIISTNWTYDSNIYLIMVSTPSYLVYSRPDSSEGYEPSLKFKVGIFLNKEVKSYTNGSPTKTEYDSYLNIPDFGTYYQNMIDFIDGTVDSIDNIDRSVSTIVKIKQIPYPPRNDIRYYEVAGEGNQLRTNVASDRISLVYLPSSHNSSEAADVDKYVIHGRYLKLMTTNNLTVFPKYTVRGDYIDLYNNIPTPSTSMLKTVLDPKCFHSDFFTIKFAYYNDFYQLKPENLNLTSTRINYNVDYQVTYGISLDFLFQIVPSDSFKHIENDYEGYVFVSSGTELSLYSQGYVDYMRNGYNYDENVHRQKILESVIGSSVNTITAAVTGFATGGVVGGVIAAGATALRSALKIGFTEAQWQTNMHKKREMLYNQTPSLTDSKNGELIETLTESRIHRFIYEPKQSERDKLDMLFHLYGYTRNLYKSINVSSRAWFNFVQGKIHLENLIPEYAIGDVSNRFEEGVTFYHKTEGKYDFSQRYENWEVSLL